MFVNACQRLYHDLAHAQGRGKSSLLKDSNITETLNKVKAMPLRSGAVPVGELGGGGGSAEHFGAVQQCNPIDVEYALEFFTKCSRVRRALHPER
jgi:hypothetical protein